MSVEAFSGLPLQAGQAVAAAAGRTARWAIAAYMLAPLRNTALVALTSLCAMAGSNALYNQSGQHPSPMFVAREPVPVMPVDRPVQLMAKPAPATTGSVSASPQVEPVKQIGNADVFEIQRKLAAFNLFDGKVDGLYGPRTARSIRAFEEMVGRKPTGQLTPEIVTAIKAAPITTAQVSAQVEIERTPVAAPIQAAEPLALVEQEAELPAPEPLVVTPTEPLVNTEPVRSEGISTLEMNSPAPAPAAETTAPIKRTVQTIAVKAALPDPTPAAAQEVVTTPIDLTKVGTDPKVVGAIQRGLSSLGFLHGQIDGVAGEATAKAIRNFEVYYNYNVTGRITAELVNLLVQNGAVI